MGVHPANTIPFSFADVRIASVVHTHGARPEDTGSGGRTAIPSPRLVPSARKGGDDAATQIQTPNALILHIGNKEPDTTIEKTVVGLAQLGACPRTAIATRPRLARPCHRSDHAGCRFDLP